MQDKVIEEAVERIPGLPTFPRVRKELMNKFNLNIREEELKEDIERMMAQEKLKEREMTIKGNRFKGYKIPEMSEEDKEESQKEEGDEVENIIKKVKAGKKSATKRNEIKKVKRNG